MDPCPQPVTVGKFALFSIVVIPPDLARRSCSMFLFAWSQRVQKMMAAPNSSPRPRRCRLLVESLEERALLSQGPDNTVVPPPSTTEPATTTPPGADSANETSGG